MAVKSWEYSKDRSQQGPNFFTHCRLRNAPHTHNRAEQLTISENLMVLVRVEDIHVSRGSLTQRSHAVSLLSGILGG